MPTEGGRPVLAAGRSPIPTEGECLPPEAHSSLAERERGVLIAEVRPMPTETQRSGDSVPDGEKNSFLMTVTIQVVILLMSPPPLFQFKVNELLIMSIIVRGQN